MSVISPPAARTTAWRLRSTCSHCASRSPGATMCPSASLASWPARKSSLPPVVAMLWLKPRGCASSGGLTISFAISCSPPHELGPLFGLERLVEAAMVLAHEQQGLRLRLRLDGRGEIHAQFVVEHALGHRQRLRRSLGKPLGPGLRRWHKLIVRHNLV